MVVIACKQESLAAPWGGIAWIVDVDPQITGAASDQFGSRNH